MISFLQPHAVQDIQVDKRDRVHSYEKSKAKEKVNVTNKQADIKELCRNGISLNDPIRRTLWLDALAIDEEVDEYYNKIVSEMFSHDSALALPQFVDSRYLFTYYLNDTGIEAITRILRALQFNRPYITYSPLLYSITALCLHYYEESLCYKILWKITDKNYDYITMSQLHWYADCAAKVSTLRSYSSKTHKFLREFAILEKDELFTIWVDWLFDHLPFTSLIPIMDCFFVEGSKMLVRSVVSVAKIIHANKGVFLNAYLDANTRMQMSQKMKDFFVEINATSDQILTQACSLKNFSRKKLRDLFKHTEKTVHVIQRNNSIFINNEEARRFSLDQKGRSATLSRLIGFRTDIGVFKMDSLQNELKADFETSVLSHADLLAIWEHLPPNVCLYDPNIIYTSLIHGKRLLTLYDKAEFYEDIILAVETMDNEKIGAYISVQLAERNNFKENYFGNGQMFLFSVRSGEPLKVYKWIGISSESALETSEELFIRCNNLGLFIGGGSGDGLYLASDLLTGASSHCKTFNNDRLTSNSLFEIKIVEVIGFEQQ